MISILVIAVVSACATIGKKFRYAGSNSNEAIIFIHGYYGANLNRKSDGERIWVRVSEVLLKSNTLALDPNGDLGIEGAMELVEDGILERAPVIFGIYSVDGYGSALDWLHRAFDPTAYVIPFSYDWRMDNREAVRALADLVGVLRKEGKRVSIIAHSMGGLIATYYLRYGSQDPENAKENWEGAKQVNRMVLAGVPFRGTMHLLRNMHAGVKLAYNRNLLKAEAVASFPSSYQLLPSLPNKILDRDLKPIAQDIFDAGWWEKEKLGLLSTPNVDPISLHKRLLFTRAQIASSKKFLEAINAPYQKSNEKLLTKILHIAGTSRDTLDKVILLPNAAADADEPPLLFTDEDLERRHVGHNLKDLMADGDESVTRESAALPAAIANTLPHEDFTTQVKHSAFFTDRYLQEAVESFLRPK